MGELLKPGGGSWVAMLKRPDVVVPGVGVLLLLGVLMIALALRMHRAQARHDLQVPGLFGVIGRMGQGKSYFLTLAASEAMRAGRAVYCNFGLKGGQRYYDWPDVLDVPDGSMVLMDECQIWWPSHLSSAPVEFRAWVTQLRKRRITALWASQDFDFVSRWLRKLSLGVWSCERVRHFHSYSLLDSSVAASRRVNKPTLLRFRVKRRKRVMALYDTFELVEAGEGFGTAQRPLEAS